MQSYETRSLIVLDHTCHYNPLWATHVVCWPMYGVKGSPGTQ